MFNERIFNAFASKVGPQFCAVNLRGMARKLEVNIDEVLEMVNSLVKAGLVFKIDSVDKGSSQNVFRMPRGLMDDFEFNDL